MDFKTFSRDTREFFRLLEKYQIRYLIVGGQAVIYHGHTRITDNIDIFYDPGTRNCQNLYQMLQDYWAGQIPGVNSVEDLANPELDLRFGYPPHRLQLVNSIAGVTFKKAWRHRKRVSIKIKSKSITLHFIGKYHLIQNKETLRRHKDIQDLHQLKS